MCLIFEMPAPETPNICEMGSVPVSCSGGWGGGYGEHDGIREESFERDTHVGYGFLGGR